jgi:hypothetical protein
MTTPGPTTLTLPALDGRTPLGFLAGLGLLRLLTVHAGHDEARLSWSRQGCTAQLHSRHHTVDDVVAAVLRVVETIPAGAVLPGARPGMPPPGAAPDRLRLPRPQLAALAGDVWEHGGEEEERWAASLVTDLALDKDGRAATSLMTAPSGKQSMRTMLVKPLAVVRRQPGVITEALTGWRRYPGVTGEYLDDQVLYDAASAPDGDSNERGVPGATWLALMAYPLLRTTAVAGQPWTTTWQNTDARPGDRHMTYPLWSAPADIHAAAALLQHPILRDAETGSPTPAAALLSIFLVCSARRSVPHGRNFAGVLTPVRNTLPNPRVLRSDSALA